MSGRWLLLCVGWLGCSEPPVEPPRAPSQPLVDVCHECGTPDPWSWAQARFNRELVAHLTATAKACGLRDGDLGVELVSFTVGKIAEVQLHKLDARTRRCLRKRLIGWGPRAPHPQELTLAFPHRDGTR
jgi:hypothetical protein